MSGVKGRSVVFKSDLSVEEINVNATNLTITSFLYNPLHGKSDWVDRIFGSKSVFYSAKKIDYLAEVPLLRDEVEDRFKLIKKYFSLPEYAIWPPCSIEMLGFIKINSTFALERSQAVFGNAIVTASNATYTESWDCFYRPLFENWRRERDMVPIQYFWALAFYCPAARAEDSCATLAELMYDKKTVPMTVRMESPSGPRQKKAQWYNEFNARVVHRDSIIRSVGKMKIPLAVCAIVPYTSSDIDKATANAAMLVEWIHYHAKLGIKVIVYDRDGANRELVFNSSYARSQGYAQLQSEGPAADFVYHDYTIRGLLDPSQKGFKYDNTERIASSMNADMDRRNRYESQGFDKIYTFTQCRFEAKALYGLDNVLIADFDEFWYCPFAEPDAEAQRKFLKQYIEQHRNEGYDQLMFPQRQVLPRTDSPRDCVVEKTRNGSSIFDCFTSYANFMGGHSVKSLHLGHKCPLTGYHQACPSAQVPRSYSCLCTNKVIKNNPWRPYRNVVGRECALVHLSTNNDSYSYSLCPYKADAIHEARQKDSELWKVAHS